MKKILLFCFYISLFLLSLLFVSSANYQMTFDNLPNKIYCSSYNKTFWYGSNIFYNQWTKRVSNIYCAVSYLTRNVTTYSPNGKTLRSYIDGLDDFDWIIKMNISNIAIHTDNSRLSFFTLVSSGISCSGCVKVQLINTTGKYFYNYTGNSGQNPSKHNFSISTGKQNIKNIIIWLYQGGGATNTKNHYIGNITFSNAESYLNNTLPVLNKTEIQHNCFNKTSGKVKINISARIYDEENNDIYYSVSNLNTEKVYFLYNEDFVTTTGECTSDKNYFSSGYIQTNSSTANNYLTCGGLSIFIDTLCISELSTIYNDGVSNYEYCKGRLSMYNDADFTINAKKVFNVNSSFYEYFTMKSERLIYKLNFLESTGKQILDMVFNQTSYGNLSIKINGTQVFNKLHTKEYNIFVYADFLYDYQQVNITVSYGNLAGGVTQNSFLYHVNYTDFTSVYHKGYLNMIHLTGFSPQFEISEYEFTGDFNKVYISDWKLLNLSDNIGNIVFDSYKYGSRLYKIYISDEYHKDFNYFNTYSVNDYIIPCEEDITIKGDIKNLFDTVKNVEYETCTALDSLFGVVHFPISLCDVVMWVCAILILILSVSILGILTFYSNIDFMSSVQFGFLFWSIGMLLLSFVIYFSNTWKLVIGICLALTLVSVILKVFISGNGGSNQNE